MGFRSPLTADQIAAVLSIPTAAENAAATDAASNSVAAASQSAVARIRSMTRVSYSFGTTDTTVTVPISVTDINRCQVQMLGNVIGGGTATLSQLPGISDVTNSAITVHRLSTGSVSSGYIEVMEWI